MSSFRGAVQGELAKVYRPDGIHVDTLHYSEAIIRTNELLERKDVTIYEAAFQFGNYFVRTDVLVKTGDLVELIEVKAKSADGSHPDQFWARGKTINSKWEPYLLDIAFQKWVLSKAKPAFIVTPYLMLTDKSAVAEIDGMNQKFVILSEPSDSNLKIRVEPGTTLQTLGSPILTNIAVEAEVNYLLAKDYSGRTFDEHVEYLAEHYVKDDRISPKLSRECRTCEYRVPEDKLVGGFKSGFKQCWTEAGGLKTADFSRPLILDIWKLHYAKKDTLLKQGRLFMDEIDHSDLEPKAKSKGEVNAEPGLSNLERQWLQVELARDKEAKPYFDANNMATIFANFRYPIHFIDFETTRTAIPFHRGRRPYEQVAFQFSHHMVHKDGRIEHKDQYLCFERGKFPNYDFVRALKKALEVDQGTIFRYADHENTVLREIQTQLRAELHPPDDADDLCKWIDSITREKVSDKQYREGERCMLDLKWLVQKFYYHPQTMGSNSIKAVLPAILNDSSVLQKKYSKSTYGTETGVTSLNFKNHTWIKPNDDGSIQDPYKTLEPVFNDLEIPVESLYEEDERVAEGGAAMTAFCRMQFTQMSDSERDRVAAALLKYCELDTFAMVLIFEYWKEKVDRASAEGRAA